MLCQFHGNLCAFPVESPDRCSFCHCSWSKITAPATRVTTRMGVSKSGERIVVEDVAYLSGYGEMPLDHWWRHALTIAQSDADTARLAAIRVARKSA